MMGFRMSPDELTFPDLLAAYADGELDADGRARVEAWLEAHPSARPIVESQRGLSRRNRRLWRSASAPAPSEHSWARLFSRMQDALDAPKTPASAGPSRRRRWRYLVPALSTAAAVAIAIYLGRPSNGPAPLPAPAAEDVLAVATAGDVDILGLDDRDASAILVGRLPLAGPVVLAGHGDVTVVNMQKAEDGMMPKAQMNEAGMAPMIVAPIAGR
jgi:anti-sigma factor RsiW